MKIAVSVESTSDLSKELKERYNLTPEKIINQILETANL